MFVQVIEGRAKDAAGLRKQMDRWVNELKPGAKGYLGSTGGITDDGTVVMMARFADEAAASANSNRPEQGAWWAETASYFDGEPTFRDSTDVDTLLEGGSNSAGFVQIMAGKVKDRAKLSSMETPEMLEMLKKARPDLIGSTRVWFADGTFVEAAYFTSEADARKGESSTEFAAPQQEYMAAFSEMTFVDLREPMLD